MNIHHSVNEYQPCKFIVPFITPIRINYDFPAVLKRLAPSLRRRSFVSFPLARTRLEFRYEFPSLSLSLPFRCTDTKRTRNGCSECTWCPVTIPCTWSPIWKSTRRRCFKWACPSTTTTVTTTFSSISAIRITRSAWTTLATLPKITERVPVIGKHFYKYDSLFI